MKKKPGFDFFCPFCLESSFDATGLKAHLSQSSNCPGLARIEFVAAESKRLFEDQKKAIGMIAERTSLRQRRRGW